MPFISLSEAKNAYFMSVVANLNLNFVFIIYNLKLDRFFAL